MLIINEAFDIKLEDVFFLNSNRNSLKLTFLEIVEKNNDEGKSNIVKANLYQDEKILQVHLNAILHKNFSVNTSNEEDLQAIFDYYMNCYPILIDKS